MSFIEKKLGIAPTLCDVIDIRHVLARQLPFFLLSGEGLPLNDGSFESSYLQYVLHHLPSSRHVVELLAEGLRVSKTILIVEEVRGPKTDIVQAKAFDRVVNDRIHPGSPMCVYQYYSCSDLKHFVEELGGKLIFHRQIDPGSVANGYLETHVLICAC